MIDLKIGEQLFIVTGASSGFGNAVARLLLDNGAGVIAVARREDKLRELAAGHPENVETVCGNVTDDATLAAIHKQLGDRDLSGIFINAGGPPAMSFEETGMEHWDEAYKLILRWKVQLVKSLLPRFQKKQYGRILFSESSTVKQPIENLVLSNSLRMAVAGAAKTCKTDEENSGKIGCSVRKASWRASPLRRHESKPSQGSRLERSAILMTLQHWRPGCFRPCQALLPDRFIPLMAGRQSIRWVKQA